MTCTCYGFVQLLHVCSCCMYAVGMLCPYKAYTQHPLLQGANAMSPSLLLSITANSSALRLDPPQLLSNATQTCDGEATCVRQSEKGIVFFSNASTPSLLRYGPPHSARE